MYWKYVTQMKCNEKIYDLIFSRFKWDIAVRPNTLYLRACVVYNIRTEPNVEKYFWSRATRKPVSYLSVVN